MYHCDNCGAQTPSGQRALKHAVSRKKEYRNHTKNEAKKHTVGYETEREMKLCSKCKDDVAAADKAHEALARATEPTPREMTDFINTLNEI